MIKGSDYFAREGRVRECILEDVEIQMMRRSQSCKDVGKSISDVGQHWHDGPGDLGGSKQEC